MSQLPTPGVFARGATAVAAGLRFKAWIAESTDTTGMTLLQAIPLLGNMKPTSSADITQGCLMRIERIKSCT